LDHRQVFFVNHFIRLHIKEPVSTAFLHGDIRLDGIDDAFFVVLLVPLGIDYPDFGVIDRLDQFPGSVILIAFTHCDYELITDGQNGLDGLGNRVIEFIAIADEGKTTDLHKVLLLGFELELIQVLVAAARGKQFFMGAHTHDFSLFQDDIILPSARW
jgi:hypothetical protein